jgi:PPP family 3-phenylpropionic acid transporter
MMRISQVLKNQQDSWVIRLFYFLLIGAGGFIYPFLNLFFIRQHLSGTQIGLLSTAGAVSGLLFAPVIGRWADRLSQPRRLLQVLLVIVAVLYLLLGQQAAFWGFAFFIALEAAASSGIEPISDTLTMGIVRQENRGGFGSVRVWGSLGWALLVPIGGWLSDMFGLQVIFLGFTACFILGALSLNWLKGPQSTNDKVLFSAPASLWSAAGLFVRDRALLGLVLSSVFTGLFVSGVYQFQSVFLDSLGASETLIGLASMVGSIVELPAMFWADRLVKRGGGGRALILAMGLDAIRMLATLLAPTTLTIILANALSGISFSLKTVAVVSLITSRVGQQQSSTALALFGITLGNLIQIIAAPIGGLAFDAVGAYWLYALGFGGYLLGLISLLLTGNHRLSSINQPAR